MKFIIFTKIPPRQGLIGPISEKIAYDEAEADSLEELQERVHVPLGGEVVIVSAEHATIIRTRVVNEVVPNGG